MTMFRAGHLRRAIILAALLTGWHVGTAFAAVPAAAEDPVQMLERADKLKTSDHSEFLRLLSELDRRKNEFSSDQQWRLRYLDAWQLAFEGRYDRARPAFSEIAARSGDPTLRVRSLATLINILSLGRHYEEAFTQLSTLFDLLPTAKNPEARFQALGEGAVFLATAGQYELASGYAQRILDDPQLRDHACQGMAYKLRVLFLAGKVRGTDPEYDRGIDTCLQAKQALWANSLRSDQAKYAIEQGRPKDAVSLLQAHYDEFASYHYRVLMNGVDSLLARAYWDLGDLEQARKYAGRVVAEAITDEYSESQVRAYLVLYQIEEKLGNTTAALDLHKKYMEADKGYLNDVSARAVAFQTVRQQVLANKMQVDSLNKQNEILLLQRKLDHKDMETSRLYIALLITVVASIAFWLLRIKRSQLRFKRLATRDSLTGIHSRQHFVDETELALRAAAKATRAACLVLVDLDHFKDVNDTHGHIIGDMVLKRAVAACQHHLHRRDVFGRLGGEEFAIYLPDCSASSARERAERIRQAIAATPLWGETRQVIITASFGVASSDRSGYDLRQLMIDADNALYQAKREGRNRVVYSEHSDLVAAVPAPAPVAPLAQDTPIEHAMGLPN
ncbi:tetratricopeptide repeat-containing diguanylate cyclase [Dyella kyungheensis]|jgi:diguanylate cyclase (GGDEF)-like protein|uniref:diguanylate cyclase n=1 Tax=Dyella kyungheensis TaxID=1242174 RepID=A0ABS2JVT4_9GAMM|nr:tetratricopeptide repeat-containing diguanylate cyclase [Dyella kyungheensis]MBM7123122.1 GGDEF domain-containing protein [Dyella kyungheensis]